MLPSIYTRSKMTYTWVQLTFASNHKTPTLFSIKLVILEQQLREIYNGTQIWVHMAFQIWTNAQKTTGHDSRELRTSFTYFYKSLSTGLLGNHVVTKYAYHNLIKSIGIIGLLFTQTKSNTPFITSNIFWFLWWTEIKKHVISMPSHGDHALIKRAMIETFERKT